MHAQGHGVSYSGIKTLISIFERNQKWHAMWTHLKPSPWLLLRIREIASLSERRWRVLAGDAAAVRAARAGLFTPMFPRGDWAAVRLERRLRMCERRLGSWVSMWILGGAKVNAEAAAEVDGVLGVALRLRLGDKVESGLRGNEVCMFERPSEKRVE